MFSKESLKELLGELPLTAEIYWHFRQGGGPTDPHFSLERLKERLPEWTAAAGEARRRRPPGKKVAVFATLHYWIEHAALLSLALAGLGHDVTLAYLPYNSWKKPAPRFDLRRQDAYARRVLRLAEPLIRVQGLLAARAALPAALETAADEVAFRDTQYSRQREDITLDDELYRLRQERNRHAGAAALSWMEGLQPDVVIIPNGTILEFGAVYAASRHLGLEVVTYEFGEQNHRIWLASNAEVMRQDTTDLWEACQGRKLTGERYDRIQALYAARRQATRWENFARQWQGAPSQGGALVRAELGLDDRPVVLLATNVIGDSLTLGRQIFTDSMTAWIEQTVTFFSGRTDAQLVIRIHPGELVTQGPSVAEVVERVLPALPQHIHLIPADAATNTYDLMEIADLGLVYTTTAGMEMVMSGKPAVVVGRTHYRGKGFTLDPQRWKDYFDTLDRVLRDPPAYRPTRAQIDLAWAYAYAFFFAYPHPFPWHLVHYWRELEKWPLARVLSAEGLAAFEDTFRYLTGEPVDWPKIVSAEKSPPMDVPAGEERTDR